MGEQRSNTNASSKKRTMLVDSLPVFAVRICTTVYTVPTYFSKANIYDVFKISDDESSYDRPMNLHSETRVPLL